jgi:hypothetical protein
VTAYEEAATRIDETPALEPYRATILADWPEGDAHYTWAATCDFAELLSWAEAVTPEDEDPDAYDPTSYHPEDVAAGNTPTDAELAADRDAPAFVQYVPEAAGPDEEAAP